MNTHFKNILITGATSGIGEALALYYAAHGVQNLFICGRNQERLKNITQRCERPGCKVHAQIIDVTNRFQTKNWIEECEKIAPLSLVIANAGVATLEEIPDNIYQTFDTNLYGVLNTVVPTIDIYKNRRLSTIRNRNDNSSLDQFIDKIKKEQKAFIMNPFRRFCMSGLTSEIDYDYSKSIAIVSSIAGYHGLPTCPSYSASKAGVKAWGEGLRNHLRKDRIKVSVICPGFVRSRITDKNTCPMPFFMEAPKAAEIIASGIEKNTGLIAFPWPVRFAAWISSILPNRLSDFIYRHLPYKV